MNKITICIPTYNGEKELSELFESILPQIKPGVALVFSDDKSTDNTFKLLKEYEKQYAFVKVFQNDTNLGMDKNFTKTVLYSESEFVWLCGQDDIFNLGAIDKFFQIINKQPETNFIYFNYHFLNKDLTKESHIKPPLQGFEKDLYFKTCEEYFEKIDHAPTFLPGIIMRRKYWDITNYEQFFYTHYVQVGVWLDNFYEGNIYVVTDSKYIVGRVPEDSWKLNSGQMIFEIFSGNFEVYKRVYESKNNCLPRELYLQKRKDYFKNFLGQIIWVKKRGLILTLVLKKRMRYLFDYNFFLYYVVVLPLIYIPKEVAIIIGDIKKILKKLIRKA